ncbi:AAA family ATPase [Paenibacillus sp. F411]|uniref:ATP-dependent nuclease n=1 Tax=Paenibacillus sp. F411 TaxID=2820239 RepID=UPI001AAEDD55|nr:AAA family ATPase [Paenibacillus sp. F411]MBO2942521.1 AAA family ATPase [Paenibacillus sp. F411]
MLKNLSITNFRCYRKHTVPFKSISVIVGKNNAGKSTIVEALRLISLVLHRYPNLAYVEPPVWTGLPKATRGVSPSLKGMDFNSDSLFYRYGTPPAILKATFDKGETVEVLLGPNAEVFAILNDSNGKPLRNKAHAGRTQMPLVNILPQVAPLLREEKVLRRDYVLGAATSPLAPLHFRNQLLFQSEYHDRFVALSESTWNGFRIRSLEGNSFAHGEPVTLLVQDDDFVAEVGWMGHGLQMWLQTMWFLARTPEQSTIILDEPDIYMHADLQRKLIKLIAGTYKQVIVATHSVEIMAEVDPENILVVDRSQPKSKFANKLPAVQRLIDNIGGIHNIQLARLWSSRKCLLVEGKDISLLKHMHHTIFPESHEAIDMIPNLSIGGWGGWNYAIGSSMLLHNSSNESIRVFCLLDRDYHTESEVKARLEESKRRKVELHIWIKKEIENYLLVPEAIARIINISRRKQGARVTKEIVIDKIMEITETLKDDTIDAIATEYLEEGKVKKANTTARDIVSRHWDSYEKRISLLSGKAILSLLSTWTQQEFNFSFSPIRIARALRKEEIPDEMVKVLTSIEQNIQLNGEDLEHLA